MYSTAGMKRELRKVFGQSPADWPVSDASCSRVARQVVERRRRFRAQHEADRLVGEIRHRHRLELRAGLAKHVERLRIHRVARADVCRCASVGLRIVRRAFELLLDVANPQRRERQSGLARRAAGWRRRRAAIPLERRIGHGVVPAVAAVDRVQHQHAVLDDPAHRPDLVHRPRQRHRAVAADAAVGRAQADDAVGDRGRDDRAERFGADREADAARRPSPSPGPPTIRSSCARCSTDCASAAEPARRPARARPSRAWRPAPRRHRAAARRRSRRVDHLILVRLAPQVVGMPLVASRSFAPHGMPCSGPRYLPALISRVGVAPPAAARALR